MCLTKKCQRVVFFLRLVFTNVFLNLKWMKEVEGKYTPSVGEQHGREDPFIMPT